MPGQRKYQSDAERQAAYRERKRHAEEAQRRNEEGPAVTPERNYVTTEPTPSVTPPRPTSVQGLVAAARAGQIKLTEGEEQFIRDQLGFSSSEKRTLAERDGVARRIVEQGNASRPAAPPGTVARQAADGTWVYEPLGPAGLSLVAFPVQVRGDLSPTPEQREKLG
jgi:hypothetical protein